MCRTNLTHALHQKKKKTRPEHRHFRDFPFRSESAADSSDADADFVDPRGVPAHAQLYAALG
jgi:hypothetical protein